jgi:hypothetical protein
MTLTAKRRERERYRGKEERAGLLPVVIYSVIIKYLLKANGQAEQLFNLSTLPRVAPPSRYETRFFFAVIVNPIFIYIVLLVRVIVDRERRLAGPEWPLNGQKGEEVDEERERER